MAPTSNRLADLKWETLMEGVWRSSVGHGPFVSLLSAGSVTPRREALAALGEGVFPFPGGEVTCLTTSEGLVLSLPLDETEKVFGLGLNFDSLDQRGTVRELKMDHYAGRDDGHTHAPVPFYVSDRGYGVFVNTSERIKVYAGTTHPTSLPHPPLFDRQDPRWRDVSVSRRVEMFIPAAGAEVLVFAGPTLLKAVSRFNLYCGGGCLPPRWGLGFWHRIHMDSTAEQAIAEAETFAAHDVPLNVIGLEPGWHTQSYPTTFEFNRDRFPDPGAFVGALRERGIRVNLWENCMVHPDSRLGMDLKTCCGNYYAGWGGLVPDLSLPEAREIMSRQHDRTHLAMGVSGYKLDECDGFDQWLWPDHAEFPSGLTGVQLRQQYGVLFQRMITELFRSRDERTYGLARASNAGAVSFPFVIYNDCYHHRQYVNGLVNSGFCGVLFTPEARGGESAEEWLRRMQAVCLSPLAMINAWAGRVHPWSFPEVADEVRKIMKLRIRLIPYLYSAFARYHSEGIPPFRALVLDGCLSRPGKEPGRGLLDSTANPYSKALSGDIRDQYLMGDSIMVAPLFAGEESRRVVIPDGRWYDFYTGEEVGSNTVIEVSGRQKDIPLYVRDGGIVPLLEEGCALPGRGGEMPLVIRHYGEKEGVFMLYDDDGETFAYEQGNFCWVPLAVSRAPDGSLTGKRETPRGRYASTCRVVQWDFTKQGDR